MSSLNNVLGNNAASLEAARAAAAQNRAPEAVTQQLRENLQKLQPGTTVTARYQYKVGADGALYPTQTQITTELDEASRDNSRRPRGFLRQQADGRRAQTLADLATPRPQLAPSDEVALFEAATSAQLNPIAASEPSAAQAVAAATLRGQAVDEAGVSLNVEILPPQGQSTLGVSDKILSLSARAQFSVANLYARNNDVVFSVTPLSQLAA